MSLTSQKVHEQQVNSSLKCVIVEVVQTKNTFIPIIKLKIVGDTYIYYKVVKGLKKIQDPTKWYQQ